MVNTENIMQGNYMLWQREVIKVDGCVASMIYFWNNGKNDGDESELKIVSCAHFDPMPLTPELLEKCGFVVYDNFNNHDVDYYELHCIRLQMCNFEGYECYFTFYDENKKQKSRQVQYLHELQNLIKVLTGKPLNINL